MGNQAVTDLVFEQVKTAFLEDVAIFEAQQRIIDLDPAAPTMNLSGDAGGLAATRLIAELVEREGEGAA